MRDQNARRVEKDRLNEFSIRPVVFGVREFDDPVLLDACIRKFLRDHAIDKEEHKTQICFISGTEKRGLGFMTIEWCKKHGYHWAEFSIEWNSVDVEGAVVRKNARGQEYNALANLWRDIEMAEVSTHGISFYDGVSSGTQDMIDRVADMGSPCAVYLVTIDSDEDNHAQEPRRG